MSSDLTLLELASITGRHPETLRSLARQGRLPGVYRLGGRWLIAEEAVQHLRNLPAPKADRGGPSHE